MKREHYISWDEYFMGLAMISAQRSKDGDTQVGACIVSTDNRVVSLGYNGMPDHCPDDAMPWGRDGEPLNTKYLYVVHAELNAILNSSNKLLYNCSLYTTLFPCNECCKAIIQSGIKRVVYLSDKYACTESTIAAKKLLQLAGVETELYAPSNYSIVLTL